MDRKQCNKIMQAIIDTGGRCYFHAERCVHCPDICIKTLAVIGKAPDGKLYIKVKVIMAQQVLKGEPIDLTVLPKTTKICLVCTEMFNTSTDSSNVVDVCEVCSSRQEETLGSEVEEEDELR